jgi:hypothetical protein
MAGLVATCIFSIAFALQSGARAKAERDKRAISDKAKEQADDARDALELTFARSLVRPLVLQTGVPRPDSLVSGDEQQSLTDPEIVALWELAESGDERLRMRFLVEATRDPLTARQLCTRSEPALIAALGLDQARRNRVAKLLDGLLEDAHSVTLAHRADLALAALELEDQPSPVSRERAEIVIQALSARSDESRKPGWRFHLFASADRLEPTALLWAIASDVARSPQDYLIGNSWWGKEASSPLELAANGAASTEVDRAVQMLGASLERAGSPTSAILVFAHSTLADRMSPVQTTKGRALSARILARALERRKVPAGQSNFVSQNTLDPLADWMRPAQAAALFLETLETVKTTEVRANLATSLTTLRPRMSPAEATLVSDRAARILNGYLEKEQDAENRLRLADCLADLAAGMSSAIAATNAHVGAETLARALVRAGDASTRLRSAWSLEKLARRMSPAEADRVCAPAARALAEALEKETDVNALDTLARGLTQVTKAMSRPEAAMICGPVAALLASALSKARDEHARSSLAHGLACVAKRLAPEETAGVLTHAIPALVATTNVFNLDPLLDLLDDDPEQAYADRVAGLIVAGLDQEKIAGARWSLAVILERFVNRIAPAEAARICAPALPHIVAYLVADEGIFESPPDEVADQPEKVLNGLKTLSSLDSVQASQAAQILSDALARPATPVEKRAYLTKALAAIAIHLPPMEAANAARVIVTALIREQDFFLRQRLADSLALLTSRIDPADAASVARQASREISDALEREPEKPQSLDRCAQVLAALVGRMEPVEAKRFCIEILKFTLKHEIFVSELYPWLDFLAAQALAQELAPRLCSGKNVDSDELNAILTDAGRTDPIPQTPDAKSGGQKPPSKPPPCRLTTQELVELLKMPTCFGKARRVVLDHLGNKYHERFVNHWAFVRYAEDHNLGLDFTTPPKRPDPRRSIERMIRALDGSEVERRPPSTELPASPIPSRRVGLR